MAKSGLSLYSQLSILSDWSSTDNLDSFEEPSFCRRTLTRTVSLGKPVSYGVSSIQNSRAEMEDAHHAVLGSEAASRSSTITSDTPLCAESPLGGLSYFAVFDGHGGARAAEFCGERLCGLLAAELSNEPADALKRALAKLEEEWLAVARAEELMDGTTAAVALLDRAAGRCVVANIGDSEVLLGTREEAGSRSFRALTEVHHVKRSASEAQRVSAAGGRVWRGRLGHPKISPQVLSLAVSRAIGDLFFKDERYTEGRTSGLIAEPHITAIEVCGQGIAEQFLLIGCDGLWDTVSYEHAAEVVFDRLGAGEAPQTISEALVRLARDAGSSDNITVMVVVM